MDRTSRVYRRRVRAVAKGMRKRYKAERKYRKTLVKAVRKKYGKRKKKASFSVPFRRTPVLTPMVNRKLASARTRVRQSDLSSHTDPIAKKALDKIYKRKP